MRKSHLNNKKTLTLFLLHLFLFFLFTISSLLATVLYIQMYHSPLIVSVHLSDYAGDQILDQVQYSSCVCLSGFILHLYQDHPQHPPVSESTQRLFLYRYTSTDLSARLLFIHLCHLSDVALGCGHFNIHY